MVEAHLYPEIKRHLLEISPAVSKVPGSTYNQGLPDYIMVWGGWPIHIEVKLDRPKRPGEPSALQREHMRKVNEAGGIGFFLRFDLESKMWWIDPTGEMQPAVRSDGYNWQIQRNKLGTLIAAYCKSRRGGESRFA